MAGIEDILVQWAPTVAPLAASVAPEEWVTLTDWQSVKIRFGKTIDDATQQFTVGTADIVVRNGDSAGGIPTFFSGESYKGLNVQVFEPLVIGAPFLGRIDRVEYHYEDTPFAAFATLHCVDTIGNISDAAMPDDLLPDIVEEFTLVAEMETAITTALNVAMIGTVAVIGEFSHQLVKAPDKFDTRQSVLDFLNEILLTEGATLTSDSGVNQLRIRGRWEPLNLLSSEAGSPVVFTDTAPNGTTTFGYRRDDLEWADADEDFYNSVQTRSKYLDKTFTIEDIPFQHPRVQLSRTELVTIRQGWVEANGRMWEKLHNQARAYPKKVKFMVGARGQWVPSIFTASVTPGLNFERQYQVLHTPPGPAQEQITYRLAIDYIEHDIDRQRYLCTLGFTSLDRWWFGYGNGTDPIELVQIDGDADHGIDSLAIIAP